MSILEHGYRIPADEEGLTEAYEEKNNRTCLENLEFAFKEVARLIEAGQVVELPPGQKPFIVNLLTVAFKELADKKNSACTTTRTTWDNWSRK